MDRTRSASNGTTNLSAASGPVGHNSEPQLASKQSSANTSVTTSPLPSRDSSPIRPVPRTSSGLSRHPVTRSRKNSYQESSPSRHSRPSVPSPAAIQRSLSATSTPMLPPTSPHQDPNNVKQPQKSLDQLKDTPRWPISPRLRSPPPIIGKPNNILQPRRGDQDPPLINVQRATPSPRLEPQGLISDSETEDLQAHSGMRTPARNPGGTSTLETVQEVSLPNSPRHEIGSALHKVTETLLSEAASQADHIEFKTVKTRSGLVSTPNESGSENGGSTPSRRSVSGIAPPPLLSRQSSSNTVKLNGVKGKGSEQMTVETETVTTIPQVSLAPTTQQSSQTSLRTKPSTETIKPKKERKKLNRKQAAVQAGMASSKADIFEAKIASAIDETNTSDSEETFVYDSNPPDTERRHNRFHSRTPSATSVMSQVDRPGMRSIHTVMEGGNAPPNMARKKGLKFVNTFNSNTDGTLGEDDSRSSAGSARGTARRHHHIGRWGRNGGASHLSLFDSDGPFPNAAKTGLAGNARNLSNPTSPLNGHQGPLRTKRSMQMTQVYDLDEGTGADDEGTPLLNASIRSNASRRGPRRPRLGHFEAQSFHHRNPSFLNRFASCLVLTVMTLLVISGAIGFMFATSQPLTSLEVVAIKNVLASEQELMLDLTVKAHNPNVVVVIIDQADIEVFAKSQHAGTDSEWWRHPHGEPETGSFASRRRRNSNVNMMDDPPDDQPQGPQDDTAPNMRLGTITTFDSPLSFEGSFFHQGNSTSTGSMRLVKPGNQTDSGTERWERIIQDEFDLVLKGVVKYSLPLSQRIRSVAISGRTTVKPNSVSDPTLNRTDFSANV